MAGLGTQTSVRASINTAYIERLNATYQDRLAPLVGKPALGRIDVAR